MFAWTTTHPKKNEFKFHAVFAWTTTQIINIIQ